MVTRRDRLRITAAAGAALTLDPRVLRALSKQEMLTRAIPSTGEPLPVVGLAVKDLMSADFRFFFGLSDDELGYLLHADAVDNEGYKYEQSMSVNKNAVPVLMEVLTPLIEATE